MVQLKVGMDKQDDLPLIDYVKAMGDELFIEVLHISLTDKKNRLAIKMKEVEDEKVKLRVMSEDLVSLYPDRYNHEDILKCFWFATWKIRSDRYVPMLEDLAQQIKNLEVAYLVAKAQVRPVAKRGKGITQEQIDVATQVPIQSFIHDKLRRSGNKFIAPCPFHSEKKGSFFIFDDNSWHCFGCQAHGNGAIGFVEKLYGYDFIEAVKFLVSKV